MHLYLNSHQEQEARQRLEELSDWHSELVKQYPEVAVIGGQLLPTYAINEMHTLGLQLTFTERLRKGHPDERVQMKRTLRQRGIIIPDNIRDADMDTLRTFYHQHLDISHPAKV
ncbi:hypothetical protein [Microcystis phage Mvi-JY20]|uniref:Uncharacterized protein n=1 Tax=Microcystis phage Mvi-JY20 TaxID=3128146 RepID=A0AAX4QGR1_9CAUD